MIPQHNHGHPFTFDAPIRVVTAIQYHVMDGYACGQCGAPSNIVRVVRMDPEGAARCGSPTLAGQLCIACARGEQANIKANHGFELDDDTCTFHRSKSGRVVALVDTTAKERALPLPPPSVPEVPAAPTQPLVAREADLLREVRDGPARGVLLGRRGKTARRLQDRGLAIVVSVRGLSGAQRRRVQLTPYGRQIAGMLPQGRRRR